MFSGGSNEHEKNRKTWSSINISITTVFSCFLIGSVLIQIQNNIIAQEIQNISADNEQHVEVILKLEGKTVKGKPKIVPAENTFAALYEKTKDAIPLKLEKTSEDTWLCNAVEG